MNDHKSWLIKDEAIIDDLMALIHLKAEEIALLGTLHEAAQTIAPALSEAFYRRLEAHPLTAEYIADQVDERRETLEQWFVQLFRGTYERDYVQDRLKIGATHVRIGLPVRYPLAMLDLIIEFGAKVTAQSDHPEQAGQAFRKLLALDIAIFNQAYEDTQLKHLTAAVGNENLARTLLIKGKRQGHP